VVDRLDVAVDGPAAAWTDVAPTTVRLLPGTEATIDVRVHPPRAPDPPAGPLDLVVQVTSAENADVHVVTKGVLEVGAYYELDARLTPEHATARRRTHHTLILHNGGNTPVTATLTGTDPDEALRLDFGARQFHAERGSDTTVAVVAVARRWNFWGKHDERPFTVSIAVEGTSKLTADATLSQRALLTLKVLLLVLLLVIGLVILVILAVE
jgi:hypothetical protein